MFGLASEVAFNSAGGVVGLVVGVDVGGGVGWGGSAANWGKHAYALLMVT